MILYHGATREIQTPRILSKNIGRDFGPAFYTTDIKKQAERWAARREMIENRQGKNKPAVVNIYDWDDTKDLSVVSFSETTLAWLDMILQCRQNPTYRHGYDLVIGKIANDNVGETISYVMQGIMRKEDALARLQFEKINNQFAFCSEKALETLSFRESYRVK